MKQIMIVADLDGRNWYTENWYMTTRELIATYTTYVAYIIHKLIHTKVEKAGIDISKLKCVHANWFRLWCVVLLKIDEITTPTIFAFNKLLNEFKIRSLIHNTNSGTIVHIWMANTFLVILGDNLVFICIEFLSK